VPLAGLGYIELSIAVFSVIPLLSVVEERQANAGAEIAHHVWGTQAFLSRCICWDKRPSDAPCGDERAGYWVYGHLHSDSRVTCCDDGRDTGRLGCLDM
jgi:hypothetical protein